MQRSLPFMFQLFYPAGYFSVFSLRTMRTSGKHSLKHKANKWLLALLVLVGIFTFSGFSASSRAVISPVQTTWVIRANRPAFKGIRFSSLKPDIISSSNKYYATSCSISLSESHSKISNTRQKLCAYCNSFNTYKIFFRINKTISQNGKAEPLPVLA